MLQICFEVSKSFFYYLFSASVKILFYHIQQKTIILWKSLETFTVFPFSSVKLSVIQSGDGKSILLRRVINCK